MENAISRRALLGGAAVGASSIALLADPLAAADAARRRVRRSQVPLARAGKFRQSVASGQPTGNGITLWTKLDDLEVRSRLQVEVARDKDFRRVIFRKDVFADPREGFTIHTPVRSKAIKPGEQYFYRYFTCNENSPVGRFKTSLPRDSREPVRIGFFSCQDFEEGFYTAHAGLMAEDDLDLVVSLGDYMYEKSFADPGEAVRPDRSSPTGETETLEDYRNKYSLYHSDARLLGVRQNFAMAAIWDDHEIEDNWARDKQGDAARNRRLPFLQRRANAFQAFFEYMPRLRTRAERDRIYGSIKMGANAEVFLLDQRQYRDDQPCGDETARPCPESERNDPARTMLGPAQKKWFKDALAASGSTWKVVGNQLMMMALDVPARNPLNPDGWDGYGAERRELIEHIRARGIQDVTFLTGDIHTFFTGVVTPSGRLGAPTDGPPVATEFVGGSITSNGIVDEAAGEGGRTTVALPADQGVLTQNPHMVYSNQSNKGYGVLEARPGELLVKYRSPGTVLEPNSPVTTLQGFRVAKGNTEIERTEGNPLPTPLPIPRSRSRRAV